MRPFLFTLFFKLGGVALGVFRVLLKLVERGLENLCRLHRLVPIFLKDVFCSLYF